MEKVGGVKVFKLYTLFAVSNLGKKPHFDTFRTTQKYGARGLWRSAICPGWGQMYKGSKAKGITMLLAEAATIGGIIFCENERASYESKMLSQPQFIKTYKTKVDNFETERNCCIGAAAAIYVYNLIDAVVAPGAERLSIEPKRVQFVPFATKDMATFRPLLAGKSETEAVNMILNFVQTAFTYGYDDEIWGGDRPFFADETLYYLTQTAAKR